MNEFIKRLGRIVKSIKSSNFDHAQLTDDIDFVSKGEALSQIVSDISTARTETIADSRLSSNVALENAANVFSQNQEISVAGGGLIIVAPNGTRYKITVDNLGTITSVAA